MNKSRPDAPGAGEDPADGAGDHRMDLVQVRVGALLGLIVGVAHVEAYQPFLFAEITSSRHRDSVEGLMVDPMGDCQGRRAVLN